MTGRDLEHLWRLFMFAAFALGVALITRGMHGQ